MSGTVGIETKAERPDAPTLTIAYNGVGVTGGYAFAVGVTESSSTGIGGVTKTQLQVAVASATHSTSTGFSATVFDDEKGWYRTIFNPTVVQSSAQAGGKYQFSARYFNEYANGGAGQWSLWGAPATEGTIQGSAADSSYPGAPRSLHIANFLGASDIGHQIRVRLVEPATNQWTIYAYQIQADTTLWTASLADALNLTSVSKNGTCDVVHGASQVTNLSSALSGVDSNVGDILFLYKAANTSTGTVQAPTSYTITANTTTTVTTDVRIPYDDTTGLLYAIGPSWADYDLGANNRGIIRGPLAGGIEKILGKPESEQFESYYNFSQVAYWRVRAENQYGWGQWFYWDNSTGTTTRASALLHTPTLIQTAALEDGAATAVKQATDSIPVGSDLVFTKDGLNPHKKFSWAAGTLYFADGTTQSINAGNTGTLTNRARYWIYATLASATLTVTSTASGAFGTNKVIVAVLKTGAIEVQGATLVTRWGGGETIGARDIIVETLSAIVADIGHVTAGIITGLLIRTASSGERIELTSSAFNTYDSGGNKRVEIPTAADKIKFYDDNGTLSGQIYGFSTTGNLYVESVAQNLVLTGPSGITMNCDGDDLEIHLENGYGLILSSGVSTAQGRMHVDQSSASGAMPVLYLDQADVSEEILQIVSTAGTGNAIEAVGAKALTTTLFIKTTVNGATVYIPAGTIA